MNVKQFVVCLSGIVLFVTISNVFLQTYAYADTQSDAEQFCRSTYPAPERFEGETSAEYGSSQRVLERRAEQISCTKGYVEGDGSGNTCNNLVTNSVIDPRFAGKGKIACERGYSEKKSKEDSTGSQPSSPDPVSNTDNPSSTVNLRLGPVPENANIRTMQSPQNERSEHMVCGISGFFGEMICGLTMFAARIADASFYVLKIFLEVKPFTQINAAGEESATYTAWSLFRGLANAFFVIAFLLVIYSYITNTGISTYNIKRMMPRLIIAALLINLSFYLSSILVDLSNIIGTTLVDTMRGVANAAVNEDGVPLRPANDELSFESVSGSVLMVSAGVAAAGAAILYAGLPVLLPVLASGLVALVTTVLILMLRQVLIIVFVILSPLAFAAILLPNTSQYFDKWKAAFMPLLMVFPAISLLYGAGYVASIAIQRTAAANGDTILQIMSLGVQIMPLFMIPAVMKLGGGLMNRWGGITSTPGQALRKKAEDRAEKMSEKRDYKALNFDPSSKVNKIPGVGKIRRARAQARVNRMKRENRNERIAENRNIAGELQFRSAMTDDAPTLASRMGLSNTTKGEALQKQVAQSDDPEQMSKAKNRTLRKKVAAHAKAVETKALQEQESGVTRNELLARAVSTDATVTALEKEAAILKLAKAGDLGAVIQMVKGSYTMTKEQRQTLVQTIRTTGAADKVPFLGNQTALDNIIQGVVTSENFGSTVVAPSLQEDDYSAATYADMDQDAATEVAQVLGEAMNGNNETISKAKLAEHELAAYTALSNPDTSSRVAQGYKDIRRIADKHISHEEALILNQLYDKDRGNS